MDQRIPVAAVVPLREIRGEDEEDTALLKQMAERSSRYVKSHSWCVALKEGFLATGIGGIIALFLFRVQIRGLSGERWLWVFMGGDVPSAYLEVGKFTTPRLAFEKYIAGLKEWADAVEQGLPVRDLIPLEISPTLENVSRVRQTVGSLLAIVLPNFPGQA